MKFGSLLSALNCCYHTGFKQAITVRLSDYYLISKVWRKKRAMLCARGEFHSSVGNEYNMYLSSQTHRPTNVHMADDITFTFLKQL